MVAKLRNLFVLFILAIALLQVYIYYKHYGLFRWYVYNIIVRNTYVRNLLFYARISSVP